MISRIVVILQSLPELLGAVNVEVYVNLLYLLLLNMNLCVGEYGTRSRLDSIT